MKKGGPRPPESKFYGKCGWRPTAMFHVERSAPGQSALPQGFTWNTLLADAESAEDLAEQFIGAELSGNASQGSLRQTELFSKQFKGLLDVASFANMLVRVRKGAQMPLSRHEESLAVRLPAGRLE